MHQEMPFQSQVVGKNPRSTTDGGHVIGVSSPGSDPTSDSSGEGRCQDAH